MSPVTEWPRYARSIHVVVVSVGAADGDAVALVLHPDSAASIVPPRSTPTMGRLRIWKSDYATGIHNAHQGATGRDPAERKSRRVERALVRVVDHPPGTQVLEPLGELDVRVRERCRPSFRQRPLKRPGFVTPGPGIPHHDFEQEGAALAGHEGPEGGAQRQLDVRPGRAIPVTAPHVAVDDEEHVRAVVAVT